MDSQNRTSASSTVFKKGMIVKMTETALQMKLVGKKGNGFGIVVGRRRKRDGAILVLRDHYKNPNYYHPSFWAPYLPLDSKPSRE